MTDNQIIEKALKMLASVDVKVLDRFVVAGGGLFFVGFFL